METCTADRDADREVAERMEALKRKTGTSGIQAEFQRILSIYEAATRDGLVTMRNVDSAPE